MRPEIRIAELRKNVSLRNEFIKEYTGFILSSASKAAGRYISREDDEYSTALIAFNEAIDRYEKDRGSFLSFAAVVIRSRIIDEARKRHMETVPFSELDSEDEDGQVQSFDPVGAPDVVSEAQLELALLKEKLLSYDISFFELPKFTPKSRKTKRETFKVIECISESEELRNSLAETGKIPVGAVIERVGASRKLMERHRKYIIAAVIILSGDYPTAAEYIKNAKGV